FFQAEDGIRDKLVTGVQTCALPILGETRTKSTGRAASAPDLFDKARSHDRAELIELARQHDLMPYFRQVEAESGPVVRMEGEERSEERRVGKERRNGRVPDHQRTHE